MNMPRFIVTPNLFSSISTVDDIIRILDNIIASNNVNDDISCMFTIYLNRGSIQDRLVCDVLGLPTVVGFLEINKVGHYYFKLHKNEYGNILTAYFDINTRTYSGIK